ncbi:MAG TPA: peptidase S58 family protein [Caldithrix abyssi]|uniref:Peptidase S58 family protein n=1 Tax=Caldithrix abyssi TaxID=187145 RepID=A0A7V4UCE3_CALAY|nr:peptidase S58 family protein [Caldithrix abyssi]
MPTGFKIGHYTDTEGITGCTVILPPQSNITSASVRGGAPGTRELALLSPEKKITGVTAVLLTGGSAFGLGAAQGVVEALAEQGVGYLTNYGVVPIVPAAVIFDKNIGDPNVYPKAENARAAIRAAKENNTANGNVGAGTGATVGKWSGIEQAMKGGLGLARLEQGDLWLEALTVVNAVGDVLDVDGTILAGARDTQGGFPGQNRPLVYRDKPQVGLADNTVLTVLMTNARINKLQAYILADKAHFGIARRIEPSHTSYDGDTAFAIAHPQVECDIDMLTAMGIKAVEASIIDAVKAARSLGGVTGWSEIDQAGD